MICEDKKNELREFCNGDEDALDFLCKLSFIFRVWDDEWDQDASHSKEEIDNVLGDLAFELSRNPFYRKHRDALEAQIFIAWNAWKDSNEWKVSGDRIEKICAWFIRDYCNEIVNLVAWLTGGKNYARSISLSARKRYLRHLIKDGIDGFN